MPSGYATCRWDGKIDGVSGAAWDGRYNYDYVPLKDHFINGVLYGCSFTYSRGSLKAVPNPTTKPPPTPKPLPPVPPPPPPPPVIVYGTKIINITIPFNLSDFKNELKTLLEANFYYEPYTILDSLNVPHTPGTVVLYTTDTDINYGYGDNTSKSFDVTNLTFNITNLILKVKFTLFKNIQKDTVITTNSEGQTLTSTEVTTNTKILYPYSIYLKSINPVLDNKGKNGYVSVNLLKTVLNNRVYSVDIEGSPTNCDSGYIIEMQQIINNCYYPNMKLSFNFIDSIGNEFSFIHDEPLVELDISGIYNTNMEDINVVDYSYPIPSYNTPIKPDGAHSFAVGAYIPRPEIVGNYNFRYLRNLARCTYHILNLDGTPNSVYGYYVE